MTANQTGLSSTSNRNPGIMSGEPQDYIWSEDEKRRLNLALAQAFGWNATIPTSEATVPTSEATVPTSLSED